MYKWLLALALCFASSAAWAQNPQCPTRPPGDSTNACASTAFVSSSLPPLPSGEIFVGAITGTAAAVALGGDCTIVVSGVVTCTKTSGTPFGTLATQSAPTGLTQCLHANASGVVSGVGVDCNVAAGVSSLTAGPNIELSGSTGSVTVTGSGQPGGRLVAQSNSCVGSAPWQLNDITTVGVVCYVPYNGTTVTINGHTYSFTTLTGSLNVAHQTTGNVYDAFLFVSGGTVNICYGPAWTVPSSTRSVDVSAGSGFLYSNSGTLTNCWNGITDFGPITAGNGLYVGTVYANVDGATQWALGPNVAVNGTNNVVGVWNAYNQRTVSIVERDGTPNWTYNTATWRPENNSALNRVTVVDGLGSSQVFVNLAMTYDGGDAAVNGGTTAICFDCVTPGFINQASNQGATHNTNTGSTMSSFGFFPVQNQPTKGLHYYQALEIGGGGTATEWFGNTYSGLFLTLDN